MNLKARLASRESIDGIVIKTPSHQVIEVLAVGGVRCVLIDLEHSLIDRAALDAMLAVARALGISSLVRVAAGERTAIQSALDAGAEGVVVPHVLDAAMAHDVVRWSHYGDGGRSFASSTRSGGWGTKSLADVVAEAASSTVVVVQVEDRDAIAHSAEIVATAGVDAVFVGPADLAVSMGRGSVGDPDVVASCQTVIDASSAAGRSVVAYASDHEDAQRWRTRGATMTFVGSDHTRVLGLDLKRT